MSKPKISVIVPIYNNEKYLSDAVDALVNQTYENMEIILVDDGSTDKTGEICDKYSRENSNVVVVHQENQGVSKARNAGLEMATGELIGFCDSDDTIDRDYFEFLYNQMTENNSDIACCCFEIISDNGTFVPTAIQGKHLWSDDDFIRVLFMGEISIAVYDKLFKRKVIENVRFPEDYIINEDKYFCFLAALNAEKISYESLCKYHYFRRVGTASMSEFSMKYYDLLKVGKVMLEITQKKKPYLIEEAQCNLMVAILILYKLMARRQGMKAFPEYEKEVYDYVKKFSIKTAKKHLKKNDYIRFRLLRMSKKMFCLFTKLIDKN